MGAPPLPDADELLASAAQFLIEGNQRDAAALLLYCDVDNLDPSWRSWGEGYWELAVNLRGPRSAYEAFQRDADPAAESIRGALRAVIPSTYELESITVRATIAELVPGWREALLESAQGKVVHNQGIVYTNEQILTWNQLRYRSKSEVRIADALDQANVFFLPNCRGRLTGDEGRRVNRDPDFLVCHNGHWGILEVDGEPFHPPSRTVHDHQRDRLFRKYGIRTVEHFDATECYQQPQEVVKKFLTILARQHAG
jgi:hypothetical protein